MRGWWTVALAGTLVAGCLATDEAEVAGEGASLPVEPPIDAPTLDLGAAVAELPVWAVGDAWTYRTSYAFGGGTEIRLVVVAIENGHYIVGATDARAAHVAIVAHWPPVGPVRTSDLAIQYHGESVALLRFPLSNASAWDVPFRGEQVRFTATPLLLDGPEGPRAGFALVGRGPEEVRFEAVYDPAIGWFRSLQYRFPGSADYTHQYELASFARNATAAAYRFDWTDAYVGHRLPNEASSPPADQVTVGEGGSYVLAALFHGGGPGVVRADVAGPMGEHLEGGGPRTQTDPTALTLAALPATPGRWVVEYATAAQEYRIFAELLLVTETQVTP